MNFRTFLPWLLLAASAVALAVSASATAQNENVVAVSAPSAASLGLYNLTVSWELLLNSTTLPTDVSDSAVFFDTASHGPTPSDYTLYPFRVDGMSADGTNFTANITAPAAPSTLYLIVLANISGATAYNATEWAVALHEAPTLSLNGSATTAIVLVQRPWTVGQTVAWPYPAPVVARLRWDTRSHAAEPFNPSNYATAEAPQVGPAGDFLFVGTAATTPSRVFFILGVTADNVTFFDPTEHSFDIAPEPTITRDSSTPWVFVGGNASVTWSVIWSYPSTPQAVLFWDTASHAPGVPADYPSVVNGTPVPATTYSFTAAIGAPASPMTIHFILRATVLGEDFFVADLGGQPAEFSIEVRSQPVPQVVSSPALAFVGYPVPISARADWPYLDAVQVSIVSDFASHGTPPGTWTGITSGVPAQALSSGAPGNFSLSAPGGPGTLYFVVRATVGTSTFYSAVEYSLSVENALVISVSVPQWTLPGSIALVRVDITWNVTLPIDRVDVYYDLSSHAPGFLLGDYANVTLPQAGAGRTFSFPITVPPTSGTLFALGHARVSGYDFVATSEATLPIPEPPRVRTPLTFTPSSGVALYGQTVNITWSFNFTELTDLSCEFRWDTASHAGPSFSFADYPNASPLITKNSTSSFSAAVVAPGETTTIYGIVRVLLQGRSFYIDREVTIVVLPIPTLELVSYPPSVETNQPMPIFWKVHFVGAFNLVSHTAIHWGLISKAGIPPLLTNYPGIGGPYRGNASNFYNASIPAQASEGHMYFIVHAVVNGVHIYLPDEYNISVVKPSGDSSGSFLPGFEGPAAAAAIAAAALVTLRHRRDLRRALPT